MFGKAVLLGRVGNKDIKVLKKGGNLTTLSIATSKKYKDSHGNSQEQTTWHNVNCFGKLAEIAEKHVHVGGLVYIEGDIQNKKIESGERTGQFAYSVHANEIRIIPSGKRESADKISKKNTSDDFDLPDDSIPF